MNMNEFIVACEINNVIYFTNLLKKNTKDNIRKIIGNNILCDCFEYCCKKKHYLIGKILFSLLDDSYCYEYLKLSCIYNNYNICMMILNVMDKISYIQYYELLVIISDIKILNSIRKKYKGIIKKRILQPPINQIFNSNYHKYIQRKKSNEIKITTQKLIDNIYNSFVY
jgi:hypothetical protein